MIWIPQKTRDEIEAAKPPRKVDLGCDACTRGYYMPEDLSCECGGKFKLTGEQITTNPMLDVFECDKCKANAHRQERIAQSATVFGALKSPGNE